MSKLWLPMNRKDGTWRVATLVNGEVEYLRSAAGEPWHCRSKLQASRKAERLNVGDLPARCTEDELAAMTAGLYLSDPMRRALRELLVGGATWSAAAAAADVTESGMLRAMRRIAAKKMKDHHEAQPA